VRNDHPAQRGDTASGQTDDNRRSDAAPGAQMILSCTRSEALGRNLLQVGRGLIG
jgi:hypothetical protein